MQDRALAKLFSAATFRMLGTPEGIGVLRQHLEKTPLASQIEGREVGTVLDSAYDLLSERYRNEYFYKNEITKKILLGRHSLSTSRLLTEFWVKDVKADLAIINGTSSVYEIKSEFDDLDRLRRQLEGYSRVFDRIFVVTSDTLSRSVLERLPPAVGLMTLTSRNRLSVRKDATSNLAHVQPQAIFKALRMGEVRSICQSMGVAFEGPNSTWTAQAWNCFKKLTPTEAHEAMVSTLRRRTIHSRQLDFIKAVPHSLKHLSIAKVLPIGSYEPVSTRLREAF